MARTSSAIIQQIITLSDSASDAYWKVVEKKKRLEKSLQSGNVVPNTLKELGKGVLSKVVAIEIKGITDTVDGLAKDFDGLEAKAKGLRVDLASLAKKIEGLATAQDKINDEIVKLVKTAKTWRGFANTKPLTDKVDALEKQKEPFAKVLDPLLTKYHLMLKLADAIHAEVSKKNAKISELKQNYCKGVVATGAIAADLVIAAGLFAGGEFTKPHELVKELHEHSKVVGTSIRLVVDGLEAINDAGTEINEDLKAVKSK